MSAMMFSSNAMPRSITTVEPCLRFDALAEAIKHGGKRGAILRIAGEDLMGDGKAVAIEHEAYLTSCLQSGR